MKYTRKQILAGITQMVSEERQTPSEFNTREEAINTDVNEISKTTTDYLIKLMNNNKNKG